MKETIINTDANWQDLAEAIVVQACKDYKDALENPTPEKMADKKKLDKFFASEYFMMLTDVSGQYLIQKVKKALTKEKTKKEQPATA